jgi:4-amino-4-deoxy-L-arabinose transferase-like glycosyltransferase
VTTTVRDSSAAAAPPAPRGPRGIPRVAWLCALIAAVNALAWSFFIPPFHVPDETAHFAYIQYLGEKGTAPKHPFAGFSRDENQTLGALGFYTTIGNRNARVATGPLMRQQLAKVERAHYSRVSRSDAGSATNNPPLYYAVGAVIYDIAPTGDAVLDRLPWLRALSALLAAATVLCTFLFIRELLPGSRWAWPLGALAAAFQPVFGFIAGGVQVDNALDLCTAGLMLAIAITLRRGLTWKRGAAVGLVLAAGLLVKTTMIAFAPAAAVAILLAAWRAREDRRAVLSGVGAAAVALGVPVLIFVGLSKGVWHRPIAGAADAIAATRTAATPNLREQLVYSWQSFLPRLGFMKNEFPTMSYPGWDLYWRGLVGRFGWLDYDFPLWVSWVCLGLGATVVAAAVSGLVRLRGLMRGRWAEFGVYVLAVLGLLATITVAGYRARLQSPIGQIFEQARYLLPLLPIYGALVAVGARALGRRWGAALGGLVVMASLALTIFGQVLTVSRYYG